MSVAYLILWGTESSELALDGSYNETVSLPFSSVDSPPLDKSWTGTGAGATRAAGKSSLPSNWMPILRTRGSKLICTPEE